MMHFLQQHEVWTGIVLFWIFSAGVSTMPAPNDKSGNGYLWLHGFLHAIAGNLNRAFGDKIPGLAPPKENS